MSVVKNSLFSLKNKVSLVTGAAGLLGKQHALALSMHGSQVVLVDLDADALNQLAREVEMNSGEKCISFVGDVTDPANIKSISRALYERDIHVNILVNNAAVNPKVNGDQLNFPSPNDYLEDFSSWDYEMDVSLKGAWICSQIFGLQMTKIGGGSIINIASDLSVISPDQRIYSSTYPETDKAQLKPVTYILAKTALVGMTRYLATLWARDGVRVNAISPGGVFTNQNPEFVKRLEFLIPMQRMADVHEYRGAVVFLGSDASSYLTGQNIVIDGGRSVW